MFYSKNNGKIYAPISDVENALYSVFEEQEIYKEGDQFFFKKSSLNTLNKLDPRARKIMQSGLLGSYTPIHKLQFYIMGPRIKSIKLSSDLGYTEVKPKFRISIIKIIIYLALVYMMIMITLLFKFTMLTLAINITVIFSMVIANVIIKYTNQYTYKKYYLKPLKELVETNVN